MFRTWVSFLLAEGLIGTGYVFAGVSKWYHEYLPVINNTLQAHRKVFCSSRCINPLPWTDLRVFASLYECIVQGRAHSNKVVCVCVAVLCVGWPTGGRIPHCCVRISFFVFHDCALPDHFCPGGSHQGTSWVYPRVSYVDGYKDLVGVQRIAGCAGHRALSDQSTFFLAHEVNPDGRTLPQSALK